ncbi:MAG: Fic family protein [Chloroflexi bacterium]|nr:Fic family protein [Chloroflexota bacterium]
MIAGRAFPYVSGCAIATSQPCGDGRRSIFNSVKITAPIIVLIACWRQYGRNFNSLLPSGNNKNHLTRASNLSSTAIGRAGRYISQPAGYRAFIPRSLPPDPPLQLDETGHSLLSEAGIALGRLDGSIQILPDADLFMYMFIRKEAVLSSQIEGTQSSLNDLLAAEAKLFGLHERDDVWEVINHVQALNHGLERLETLPLSMRLIKEIHGVLIKDVRGSQYRPGEFRTSQNWIGAAGSTINEAVFVPPPPHEMQTALGELEKFWHSMSDLPILVKVALVHAQFETIHPFLDGNGRIGRLLVTFLLIISRTLRKPALFLSEYFIRRRDEYYLRLQAVRDEGAWEEWVMFFLRGVLQVSDQAALAAAEVVALREEHRQKVTENFGRSAANGLRILELLYKFPVVNVNLVSRNTKIGFGPANLLIARFVEEGLLAEITGNKRNRLFQYKPYTDLFAGGP